MSFSIEGQICIPAEEFWEFACKYLPSGRAESRFGVPKMTRFDDDMTITFAASSISDPSDWGVKPDCLKEWKNKGEK